MKIFQCLKGLLIIGFEWSLDEENVWKHCSDYLSWNWVPALWRNDCNLLRKIRSVWFVFPSGEVKIEWTHGDAVKFAKITFEFWQKRVVLIKRLKHIPILLYFFSILPCDREDDSPLLRNTSTVKPENTELWQYIKNYFIFLY